MARNLRGRTALARGVLWIPGMTTRTQIEIGRPRWNPNVGDEMASPTPPGIRCQKGGDLYREPKTREEMLVPLKWHEKHMARAYRYGVLATGELGFRRVA